ncbi:Putative protein in type-1 R1DM retrotransposable element [Sarcoptes scabiei]|uniref:Reverse transcriptase domain-containing protein n=1 Tax=Sarcoptes scabiei TaxID=52283 RepID=A0A834R3Y5_SARSC|nr:Putative protein in type-1 R1DM retrotransposable element [Sarcoptes scabiei]
MMFNKLKIHQQNLRKSLIATQQLLSNLENTNTDIIIMQEPYTRNSNKILGFPSNSHMYQTDENSIPKTGIFVNNLNLYCKKIEKFTNAWMTTIQIQLFKSLLVICNVYIEPNTISSHHIEFLRDLLKTYENVPLILTGDFNARHTLWNDRIINKHGECIYDLIIEFDLFLHNNKNATCLTINGTSIIDLTLSNHRATPHVKNWTTKINHQTIFDHALIGFEYGPDEKIPQRMYNTTRRFNEKKADWTKFKEYFDLETINNITRNIEHAQTTNTIDYNILRLTEIIQKAALHSIPIIKRSNYHKKSQWWDNELKCMQIVVQNKRYLFTKERDPRDRQCRYDEYKLSRNIFINTMRKKKLQKWKEFIEEIDTNNTWGNTHKQIKQKLNPKTYTLPILDDFPPSDHRKIIENIVNSMFPTHHNLLDRQLHQNTSPEQEYNISKEYIESLISKSSSKKAPGSDNITNAMLKPDKQDYHDYHNYRPISLLPNIGKLLEKILQFEIQNFLMTNNKINPQQHGFTRSKSTITALQAIKTKILTEKRQKLTSLIAIDFTGAFDNADWSIIIDNMHQLQLPQHLIQMMHSYFQHRTITMKHNTNEYSKVMTKGCPQGSPLSPLLWNILINKLLDTFNTSNASIYAYADDLTVICSATKLDDLHMALTNSMHFINSFSHSHNLKINFTKTKILNFHKKTFNHPVIIDSNIIEIVDKMKILGVTFENHHIKSKLNFGTHIKNVMNKAMKIKNVIFNYCKNTFGIDNKKRRNLFKGMIRPILTYGSEIWSDQINKKQKNSLESIQHQLLKNSVMGFKTVSKMCVQSLTKTVSLNTHINIKKMKFFHKCNIQRIDTDDINKYIQDYKKTKITEILSQTNENFKSFFVNNFIPNFIHTNFYTTQFLTGHGPFGEYFHKLRIIDNPSCTCDNSSMQNPSHLLLNCPHYSSIKRELNLHHIMDLPSFIVNKENFKRFKKLCKYIHDHLRSIEASNRQSHYQNDHTR